MTTTRIGLRIVPLITYLRDSLRSTGAARPADGEGRPEHTLFAACEFWSMVGSGALVDQLQSNAVVKLRYAQDAFAALGAVHIASTLRAAVTHLTWDASLPRVRKAVEHIEDNLSATEDRVDDLIAQFAIDNFGAWCPLRPSPALAG